MEEVRSRTLDQEPDAIAIIPKYCDFMVVGTYSKIPEPEGEEDGNPVVIGGGRKGMIKILPCSFAFDVLSALPPTAMSPVFFDSGVYDVSFHPQYDTLLGVATSDAEVLLFDVKRYTTTCGTSHSFEMNGLGKILIEEPHPDDGRRAIITRIQFLNLAKRTTKSPDAKEHTVFLVATTQFGNTKLVQVMVQPDATYNDHTRILESQTLNIHKQAWDTEAWTVLPIVTSPTAVDILSGGDDSKLLISRIDFPLSKYGELADLDFDLPAPVKKINDGRSHEAGVVEICAIGLYPPGLGIGLIAMPELSPNIAEYLVLSGSYDEKLRLFIFSPENSDRPATKMTLVSEVHLGAGVWRIICFDKYDIRRTRGRDYLLAIANHTGGACIVRLSCTPAGAGVWNFAWKIEKWFPEGKDGFVYAVAARPAVIPGQIWDRKSWIIVSASFYEKKVYERIWVDETKLIEGARWY